jgi:septation ring formation regulator EzrA
MSGQTDYVQQILGMDAARREANEQLELLKTKTKAWKKSSGLDKAEEAAKKQLDTAEKSLTQVMKNLQRNCIEGFPGGYSLLLKTEVSFEKTDRAEAIGRLATQLNLTMEQATQVFKEVFEASTKTSESLVELKQNVSVVSIAQLRG